MKIEDYKGLATFSRYRNANVAQIVLSDDHGLFTGETVTITGLGGTGYNQSDVTVTVINSTTFTYANTGSNEGVTGDTGGLVYPNFTFQYNPLAFDDSINKFVDRIDVPYGYTLFGTASPDKSTRPIVVTGHFSKANKATYYKNLSKHVNSNKLKKLFFGDDNFYIVTPLTVKKTNSGGRTNFIDYVATFVSPFGILFNKTQKSGGKTSSEDNEGNTSTLIEKIVTTSVTNGTTYTYKDKDKNGFKIKANASGTLTIYLVYQYAQGGEVLMTEYQYALIGSAKQPIAIAESGKDNVLRLNPGETLNERFNTGDASIPANTTFYFRHGYSGE